MLIALGIILLSVLFGGGSPHVIPKLDHYVKTHVVDDGRKEIVLEHLKDAEDKRKESEKKNAKHIKNFKDLLKSRSTKREDLEVIIVSIREAQDVADQANIEANIEAQKNITKEEWAAIQVDIVEALNKNNKQVDKLDESIRKGYDKWKKKIGKTIADKAKNEKAVAAAENLKVIYLKNRNLIQKEVSNGSSILYQYEASREDLDVLQNGFMDMAEDVLKAAVDTHFELLELTTEDEWKKIL